MVPKQPGYFHELLKRDTFETENLQTTSSRHHMLTLFHEINDLAAWFVRWLVPEGADTWVNKVLTRCTPSRTTMPDSHYSHDLPDDVRFVARQSLQRWCKYNTHAKNAYASHVRKERLEGVFHCVAGSGQHSLIQGLKGST